jgi:alkanesulfonate monooxygenase SsuD/methylene tetrahydromethanopterin reductase-like flavin-dependent oxidoreductase (luciferase family)
MDAPPPIYVGGRGDPALNRAARFGDFWLPMWMSPEKVAERSGRLVELAAHHDRPTPATAFLVLIRIDDDHTAARAQAGAHIGGQYRMGLDAVERWTVLDSIDGAVERLEAYRAVGVQELVLLPLGDDPLYQYERLAEVRARLGESQTATSAR